MKFFTFIFVKLRKSIEARGFWEKTGFFELFEKTGGKIFGRAVIDFWKFFKFFNFFLLFFTYSDFKKYENFSFLTMGSSPWFSQEIWPKTPKTPKTPKNPEINSYFVMMEGKILKNLGLGVFKILRGSPRRLVLRTRLRPPTFWPFGSKSTGGRLGLRPGKF